MQVTFGVQSGSWWLPDIHVYGKLLLGANICYLKHCTIVHSVIVICSNSDIYVYKYLHKFNTLTFLYIFCQFMWTCDDLSTPAMAQSQLE